MGNAPKARKPKLPKFTVYDFNALFPDEETCLDFILHSLYPEGVTCRKCQRLTKHHRLMARKAYSCQVCGTHVYPLAGTIFAKSRTPLRSWFYALYLMASTRCGISAKQLERELGVTYKTAWRMFKQIRMLLSQDELSLGGIVEADESYFGGAAKWKHQSRKPPKRHPRDIGKRGGDKTPVLGMVQRGQDGQGGKVVALVVSDASSDELLPRIATHVLPETTVYTDEWKSYLSLEGMGYTHDRIPHRQGVYVSGDVHTQTVEGFWALVKRGISGVYHSVSDKYLQTYLDEYAFRYNHRDGDEPMFGAMADQVASTRYGRYGKYQPID